MLNNVTIAEKMKTWLVPELTNPFHFMDTHHHVAQCLDTDGFKFDEVLSGALSEDDEIRLSAGDMAKMGLFRLPYPHTYVESVIRAPIATMAGQILGVDEIPVAICAWESDETIRFYIFNKMKGRDWTGRFYSGTASFDRDVGDFRIETTLYRDDVDQRNAVITINKAFGVLERLVVFLATDGIEVRKIEAPIALNKKRARKGKAPLRDYHVLRLSAATEKESRELGGTHASPRIHFRRGHIRTLADGRELWIKSTIVGLKTGDDWVRKEYKV